MNVLERNAGHTLYTTTFLRVQPLHSCYLAEPSVTVFHVYQTLLRKSFSLQRQGKESSMTRVKRKQTKHSTVLYPLQAIRSGTDTNWSLLKTILKLRPHRTFVVQNDQGSVLIRNRRY